MFDYYDENFHVQCPKAEVNIKGMPASILGRQSAFKKYLRKCFILGPIEIELQRFLVLMGQNYSKVFRLLSRVSAEIQARQVQKVAVFPAEITLQNSA